MFYVPGSMTKVCTKISGLTQDVLSKEGEEVVIVEKPKRQEPKKLYKKDKDAAEEEEKWPLSKREGQLVVDIYEKDKSLIIESTIAGVRTQDIDITVEPDLIVIRGERIREAREEAKYYYQECFWGTFSRTLVLPYPVKPEKVKANLRNGILTIVLPRATEEGRDIEVGEE